MAEQITVTVGKTGYVSRQSCTPRRASGIFFPPFTQTIALFTDQAQRHQHPEPSSSAEGEDSQLPVPGSTPVRQKSTASLLSWESVTA